MTKSPFRNLRSLFFVSLTSVSMLACSSSGSTGDLSNPEEAQQQLIEETCASAHRCRADYPAELAAFIPFEALFGTSASQCETNLQPEDAEIQAMVDAVEAGRATYDADKAELCLNEMSSVACTDMWADQETESACDTVFVGTIADGAACTTNVECVSQDCEDGVCAEDF